MMSARIAGGTELPVEEEEALIAAWVFRPNMIPLYTLEMWREDFGRAGLAVYLELQMIQASLVGLSPSFVIPFLLSNTTSH